MDPALTCSFLVWLQLMAYFLSNWDNNGSPPTKKQEIKKIRGKETQFSLCIWQAVKFKIQCTLKQVRNTDLAKKLNSFHLRVYSSIICSVGFFFNRPGFLKHFYFTCSLSSVLCVTCVKYCQYKRRTPW